MAKSNAEKVRDTEARKRAAGLKEIRVWVPDDPDAVRQVRDLAASLAERS